MRLFAILGTVVQVVTLLYLLSIAASSSLDYYQGDGSGSIESTGDLLVTILATTALAGTMGVFGLILNLFTAIAGGYRARWFFCTSLPLAMFYTIVLPVGTLLGPGFAIWLLLKRREFLTAAVQGS